MIPLHGNDVVCVVYVDGDTQTRQVCDGSCRQHLKASGDRKVLCEAVRCGEIQLRACWIKIGGPGSSEEVELNQPAAQGLSKDARSMCYNVTCLMPCCPNVWALRALLMTMNPPSMAAKEAGSAVFNYKVQHGAIRMC